MKTIRTDLALESHEISKRQGTKIEGVIVEKRRRQEIDITSVNIIDERGEKALGKHKGKYITIECPNLVYDTSKHKSICSAIASEIRKIADINTNTFTLVVGLGNNNITPDALGTECISHIMITHHLKKHMSEYIGDNLSTVCAITPGVLGTTGIESSDIIKYTSENLNPDLIIVIDALAAGDIKRLANTIQISDAGIQPGAGIGNDRCAINKKTTGASVIAIGVPTVIDASNISDAEIPQNLMPLMVTTKDIDIVIQKCAQTIAYGINLALHPGITLEQIESFMA